MCGLVFAGGKVSMSRSDVDIFEQFLQCDTYRGEHSTGVASIFKPYNGLPVYRVAKAAVDGFDFVKTPLFSAVTQLERPSAVNSTTSYKVYPKALFGHNRWATMGAVNAINAHPFEVDHIILAHNGTLTAGWKSKMLDGALFEVDSHCVANSVAKLGIAETIQRMRGAYALIWFNKDENTLNFLRNDERPFHFWETLGGDWFGCSEEKMGDWLLTRGKIPRRFKRHFEAEPGVQYIFDVSDGCVLKEEVRHELPRFQFYSQTTSAYSGYSNSRMLEEYADDDDALDAWWQERINQRSADAGVSGSKGKTEGQTKTAEASVNDVEALVRQEGIFNQLGDVVSFEMFEYKAYPKKPGYGYVKGYIPTCDNFVEVQVHDVKESEFGDGKVAGFRFISAYSMNGVVTMIGRPNNDSTLPTAGECVTRTVHVFENLEEKGGLDDDQDFSFLEDLRDEFDDVPPVSRTLMSGESFTEKEWKKSTHSECALCGNPIPFEECESATIENQNYCFCGDCIEATEMRKSDKGTMTPSKGGTYCSECGGNHGVNVMTGDMTHAEWTTLAVTCFWKAKYRNKFMGRPVLAAPKKVCTACGEEVSINKMSKEKEGVCSECYTRFHQPTVIRTSIREELAEKVLANGMRVTEANWLKMNSCRCCGKKIPFGLAGEVEFWGAAPVCPDCGDDMGKGA